jgi:hypothetical protein
MERHPGAVSYLWKEHHDVALVGPNGLGDVGFAFSKA